MENQDIRKAGLKVTLPRVKILEILETSAIDDSERVTGMMERCRALGVRFSLDDFGTGYSTLNSFRQLPMHDCGKLPPNRTLFHHPSQICIRADRRPDPKRWC